MGQIPSDRESPQHGSEKKEQNETDHIRRFEAGHAAPEELSQRDGRTCFYELPGEWQRQDKSADAEKEQHPFIAESV
jgi:hypothetical protein